MERKTAQTEAPEAAAARRGKAIVRTGVIGILTNLLLAGFKAAVGMTAHSIAVTLDAVNNLSDALSSVITIVGARLAGRRPDKKHPLGHGRVEYLSATVVSALVLYAGVTALAESVKKILHPVTADYSALSLIVIAAAVAVKIVLGLYVKRQGRAVDSGALVASGTDALMDAVLSASVLASALVYVKTGRSLEAYVGVIIAGFIIKSGVELLAGPVSDLVGRRADPALTRQVRAILEADPAVHGAYDLIMNNYGPGKYYASVHLELDDVMTVDEVDVLTRKLETQVYHETGVILTGVGVYSFNTADDEAARLRNEVTHLVMTHEWALQLHGFYADTRAKTMRFDVVFSFDISPHEGLRLLQTELAAAFPDYTITVTPDVDVAD
ncbi:MAG: cation transporter [Clostridia bacterium]|nr:cation transporter [Clostridia bacterium]